MFRSEITKDSELSSHLAVRWDLWGVPPSDLATEGPKRLFTIAAWSKDSIATSCRGQGRGSLTSSAVSPVFAQYLPDVAAEGLGAAFWQSASRPHDR